MESGQGIIRANIEMLFRNKNSLQELLVLYAMKKDAGLGYIKAVRKGLITQNRRMLISLAPARKTWGLPKSKCSPLRPKRGKCYVVRHRIKIESNTVV